MLHIWNGTTPPHQLYICILKGSFLITFWIEGCDWIIVLWVWTLKDQTTNAFVMG